MTANIEPTTSIEDLVTLFPASVSILLKRNLPCLVCGEPVWGTVEELARNSGWKDPEVISLIEELNKAYAEAIQ